MRISDLVDENDSVFEEYTYVRNSRLVKGYRTKHKDPEKDPYDEQGDFDDLDDNLNNE